MADVVQITIWVGFALGLLGSVLSILAYLGVSRAQMMTALSPIHQVFRVFLSIPFRRKRKTHRYIVSQDDPQRELNLVRKWAHDAEREVLVLPRAMSPAAASALSKQLVVCAAQHAYEVRAILFQGPGWPLPGVGSIISIASEPPKQPFVVIDRKHLILLDPEGPKGGREWKLTVFENDPRAARRYAEVFRRSWETRNRAPVDGEPKGQGLLVAYNLQNLASLSTESFTSPG